MTSRELLIYTGYWVFAMTGGYAFYEGHYIVGAVLVVAAAWCMYVCIFR